MSTIDISPSPEPLLVPPPRDRPASPEPAPLSPNTVRNTLEAHPDLNNDILCTLVGGLITTISKHDQENAVEKCRLR
jgi:hypothetical protein